MASTVYIFSSWLKLWDPSSFIILSKCDLMGANMLGVILREANLTDCHLEGAVLSVADMQHIKADTIHLDEKTDLRGVKIDEKSFNGLPLKFRESLIEIIPCYAEFKFWWLNFCLRLCLNFEVFLPSPSGPVRKPFKKWNLLLRSGFYIN